MSILTKQMTYAHAKNNKKYEKENYDHVEE